MVEKLRSSFKEMLAVLPWMGDATKVIGKEKVIEKNVALNLLVAKDKVHEGSFLPCETLKCY